MYRRALFIALALLLMFVTPVSAAPPEHSVSGHGTLLYAAGAPNGGQFIHQIGIEAKINTSGNVTGKATWTGVYHSVPADPNGSIPPGKGNSGVPWHLNVTALSVSGNVATVEAVVVSSPQIPSDVGKVIRFTVTDNGKGKNTPDTIAVFRVDNNTEFFPATPITNGNLVVK